MSYTYASYQTALAALLVVPPDDENFQIILPSIIDYAEQRIYRELDLVATSTRQVANLTAGSRSLNIATAFSSAPFVIVQGANIITPAATTADSGVRNPCHPASGAYLDAIWNSAASADVPQCFTVLDSATMLFGPWPDQAYVIEVLGTVRPAPLYSGAIPSTTFLSLNLPDLFMAASMIFASGYQKNFGAQSDDPRTAVSWETQYQTLFASANSEEMRKKFAASPVPKAT
jgi:hypothetical protein